MRRAVLAGMLLSLGFSGGATAQGMAQEVLAIEEVVSTAPLITDEMVRGFIESLTLPSLGGVRWSSPICVKTVGLPPGYNDLVTQTVKKAAANVGAPVREGVDCNPNVTILFTAEPQTLMDAVRDTNADLLGWRNISQIKDLAVIRYPIQAWYTLFLRDSRGQSMPLTNTDAYCDPYCALDASSVPELLLSTAVIVVDAVKVNAHSVETVADYAALLALTRAPPFRQCLQMPSIANLVVAGGCPEEVRTEELSPGDLAFLRGLYRMSRGESIRAQKAELAELIRKGLFLPARRR